MQTLRTIRVHFSGTPGQRRIIDGVQVAIYRAVLLVPGVHQGIGSEPALYTPEVIAASADKWNNKPVPIGHPVSASGDFCLLAENPALQGQFSIGTTHNPISKLGKLIAELALDVKKANSQRPGMLQDLDMGRPMDVSTGLLAIEDRTPGIWNGEPYSTKILEIIPDHLALLPGATGACSWSDGCGVRVNSNYYEVNQMEQEVYVAPVLFAKTNQAVQAATTALVNQHGELAGRAKARQMTLSQLIQLGEALMNAKDDERQQAEEEVYVPVSLFQGGAK